ncbi:hypothetical protein SDJN03_25178, partial [Cucurbita argyrosperma subsp. sororia]
MEKNAGEFRVTSSFDKPSSQLIYRRCISITRQPFPFLQSAVLFLPGVLPAGISSLQFQTSDGTKIRSQIFSLLIPSPQGHKILYTFCYVQGTLLNHSLSDSDTRIENGSREGRLLGTLCPC